MSTVPLPRALALLVVALVASATPFGCSLVIETRDQQCEKDADCSGFDDAVCDTARGVCVARTTGTGGGGGGASCEGPDGCYACAPTKQEEFLNACTDVTCVPYDNAQLEGLLNPDGTVPAVP